MRALVLVLVLVMGGVVLRCGLYAGDLLVIRLCLIVTTRAQGRHGTQGCAAQGRAAHDRCGRGRAQRGMVLSVERLLDTALPVVCAGLAHRSGGRCWRRDRYGRRGYTRRWVLDGRRRCRRSRCRRRCRRN